MTARLTAHATSGYHEDLALWNALSRILGDLAVRRKEADDEDADVSRDDRPLANTADEDEMDRLARFRTEVQELAAADPAVGLIVAVFETPQADRALLAELDKMNGARREAALRRLAALRRKIADT